MANLIQIKNSISFTGSESDAITKVKAINLKEGEIVTISYKDTDNKTKSLLCVGSTTPTNPFIYYDKDRIIVIDTYTKAETDTKLLTKVDKTTTINGKPLSANVTLAAGDVNAYAKSETYSKTEVDAQFNVLNSIQIDNAGGTKTLAVIAPIVSVTAGSQVNYIGFTSTFNSFTIVNNSTLQIIFSLVNSSAGTNQISKDSVVDTLILPSGGAMSFMKISTGWKIKGMYGLSYFPDLVDDTEDEYAMIVKKDGTARIENVGLLKEIDESVTTDLTAADLDARFPSIYSGFQLICPTNNRIYEKISDIAGWVKYTTEKVV